MARSAADAVTQAIERSKQLLFPFKGEKWFALGFTVFLAQCGESGSAPIQTPQIPFPSGPSGRGGPSPYGTGFPAEMQKAIADALSALRADLALYITLAIAGVVLIFGIWAFVLWFSSRAKLMFVESVIWDRVDIGKQWGRAGELGLSLFKFRALLGIGGSLLMLLAVGGAVAAGFPDFEKGQFLGPRALACYAVLGASSIFFGIPLLITSLLLDDFVVPLMVLRNARVREAWSMCRGEVLAGNLGGVFVFYLLRVALAFGIGLIMVVLTCVTCCLMYIPYINTVLLLPIFTFSRAYPLYYMEQLGISVFPPPEPSWAAYDQWRFPR
jgi:hypothetical protein